MAAGLVLSTTLVCVAYFWSHRRMLDALLIGLLGIIFAWTVY